MKTKIKLIKTVVDKAPIPSSGDAWIWDTDLQGFGLRIQPTGRKTYIVRYRAKDGTQRKQTIARSSHMPPEKARELARKVFGEVAGGQDAMANRKPAKTAAQGTVGKLFEAYVASMREKGRTSASEVERALLRASNNAADALGRDRPASEVTPMDIVDYVSLIFKTGRRGAADKHRGYIASAFTWAMKSAHDYTIAQRQNWSLTHNPAAVVAKDSGATRTRDRNLSVAELGRLWRDTVPGSPGFAPEMAACIRLLIACGQRVQETLRLEGAEIDFKACIWRTPAHKTKMKKKPHVIPLPGIVLHGLNLLIAINGNGKLFLGRNGKIMDHRSVMQAIERWCERTDTPACQTWDLRRTWKSRAGDGAKISREVRDLIQQHAKNDTGSVHYDRADYLPAMREAMEKWSEWIDANLEQRIELSVAA